MHSFVTWTASSIKATNCCPREAVRELAANRKQEILIPDRFQRTIPERAARKIKMRFPIFPTELIMC